MKIYIKSAIMNPLDEDVKTRKEFAQDKDMSPELLSQLAKDTDIDVRRAAMKNPNLPDASISDVINDTNQYVRVNVAKNPNTSPDVLTLLAKDRSNKVKIAVAGNPNTPPDVLCQILPNGDGSLYDDHRFVEALLKNPSTPMVYRKALVDGIYEFRYRYPGCYTYIELLRKLVGNKKTPKELVNYIEPAEIELLRYWRQKAPELYSEGYHSPILVALGYVGD